MTSDLSVIFVDVTPKHRQQQKIDKWDVIKIKNCFKKTRE